MKRNLRSTVLSLVTSGMVVVGSAACGPGGVGDLTTAGEDPDATTELVEHMGQLEFLAPGEFIIDGNAFFVTEETQILGGLNACPTGDGPDDNGFGTVECDLETLETAAQGDTAVFARAEVDDDGNAESIIEYDDDSQQGSSEPESPEGDGEAPDLTLLRGELEYIAPGEYMVDNTSFYVSENTLFYAGVYACADGVQDPDTGDVLCDFDEFDATLANGTTILAEVEVVNGIAEYIAEYEE